MVVYLRVGDKKDTPYAVFSFSDSIFMMKGVQKRGCWPKIRKEMYAMSTLQGAVVVVTGASRGIGRAIAEELGQGGAKVVVNYARSKEPAEELVMQLMEHGSPQAVAIQADVADAAQAARLIEGAVQQLGPIDALFNNPCINLDRTMKKLTLKDWNTVIQVDLNSYFYTVKAALPYFTEQKSGKIINISSFLGQIGNFSKPTYSASKPTITDFT